MSRTRAQLGKVRRAAREVARRTVRRGADRMAAADDLARVVGAEVDRHAGGDPVRVAVIHADRPPAWAADLSRAGAAVTTVDVELPDDDRHALLTACAPFDVVVDAVPGAANRPRRLMLGFYQLRRGGSFVVRGGARELGPDRGPLGELLERAAATRGEPVPKTTRGVSRAYIDEHALDRAIAETRVDGRHLVLVHRADDVLAKLRYPQLADLMERRPDLPFRVLRTIPAESFESRCAFSEVGTQVVPLPTAYDAPDVPLLEYDRPLVAPGQIVVHDRLLLPDTFRHWQEHRLQNTFLDDQARWFARLADETEPTYLPGRYFHLDNEVRGHYGHLMTETLSRVWAWAECKAADPDLKVLVGTNRRTEIQPYEFTIYAAAGIAPEDVVLVDGPVRVDQLVSAAPLFSNPDFVHPQIRDTWRQVGDTLAAQAEGGPRPGRFFVSRRINKRACRNTPEVEQLFRDHGFEVVFPEDYSLGDQVEMFRAADVIAGFAGSGLFNLCFVHDHPVHMISLRSESYTATNEYLMASLLGHSFQSVVSRPENPNAFQSPWSVDLDAEGRQLVEILDALPR